MRLWADSDEVTPGYWFRVPDDTPALEGGSVFRKRSTWNLCEPQPPGPGEIMYPQAPFYHGENLLGYDGRRTCGSLEAMRTGGVHGRDPVLVTRPDGSLECCFPPDEVLPPLGARGYASSSVVDLNAGDYLLVPGVGFHVAGRLALLAIQTNRSPLTPIVPAVTGWDLVYTALHHADGVRVSVYARVLDGTEIFPLPYNVGAFAASQAGAVSFDAGDAEIRDVQSVSAVHPAVPTMPIIAAPRAGYVVGWIAANPTGSASTTPPPGWEWVDLGNTPNWRVRLLTGDVAAGASTEPATTTFGGTTWKAVATTVYLSD